jgi:hypothetical protein
MRVYTFKATDYRELGFFFDKQTAGIFPSSSTKQSKKKIELGMRSLFIQDRGCILTTASQDAHAR